MVANLRSLVSHGGTGDMQKLKNFDCPNIKRKKPPVALSMMSTPQTAHYSRLIIVVPEMEKPPLKRINQQDIDLK